MSKFTFSLKTILKIFPAIAIFYGCAGTRQSENTVSSFSFKYKGEQYRILSGSIESAKENFNQLLGKGLIAVDLLQDGVLDQIKLGNITQAQAQNIYDYGIELARESNKLKQKPPSGDRFLEETFDSYYEIVTLKLNKGQVYNQFKISKKYCRYPELIVSIDRNADGSLDEILKGSVNLKKLQADYSSILQTGLKKGRLIRYNNMIIVKNDTLNNKGI
ncbi:hypothetical protein J7K93_02170 [bacterium]|nr:hypothetical protein [bacterium]